ncbi:MAG: hypothetical protein ACOC7V_07660 [Spirochaetota bacterium]
MVNRTILMWLSRVLAIVVIVLAVAACAQPTGADPPGEEPTGADSADDPGVDDPGVDSPPPEVRSLAIDFQNATEGVVAAGFDGSGAMQEPGPGQLDADVWEVLGFSDGDRLFGEESTTGDHARGTSAGGVSTGGLYAFTVEDGNVALGVQPTAGDFAPGSITLRVPLELWLETWMRLDYTLWYYNDQDRSTVWSVAFSLDGESWTELDAFTVATPELADPEPGWTSYSYTVESRLDFFPDLLGHDALYLRWTSADYSGTGGRDETAIDDIAVSFTPGT